MALDPKYDSYDYPTTNPGAASGHFGHIDEVQSAKLFQFRAMLEQKGYNNGLDTLNLLRFLRARKWDVQKAFEMFTKCADWRKEFGTDEIAKTFTYPEKPRMFKFYPQYYHKTDKDGRPVYIEQMGKIDLNEMHKITSEERMLQNLVYEYEKMADPRLPACSRKVDRLVETCCTIMDMKGVGITSIPQVYGYVKKTSVISQDYYPERLGKLYIINAPWGFASVFSIIKGFLDPVTVAKINVLGWSYQTDLMAQIPAENLPEEFGGSCKCDDTCQLSDAGPWRDPQYMTPGTSLTNATGESKATETQSAAPPAPAHT